MAAPPPIVSPALLPDGQAHNAQQHTAAQNHAFLDLLEYLKQKGVASDGRATSVGTSTPTVAPCPSDGPDGSVATEGLGQLRCERDRLPADESVWWEPRSKFTYESLDYVDVENELLREDRVAALEAAAARSPAARVLAPVSENWQRWVLLTAVGALTGLAAFGIDRGIQEISARKWRWVGAQMEADGSATVAFWPAYGMLVAINLALCLVAAVLVVYGEPLAAGSGIPEVKCYLNGVRVYRIARLKTLFAKGVGILFSVSSGLPCGKEGPMIHSGAVIGGGVATGKSSRFRCDTGLFKEYRGDRDKRMFFAAGAAAGVAVAFGAPVGGVLFAVEEAVSWWTVSMSVQIFYCATVASLSVNMFKKSLYEPQQPASGVTNFGTVTAGWTLGEIPLFFLLGALGGVAGAVFVNLNLRLTRLRKRLIAGVRWRRVAEALAVNMVVSTTLFVMCSRLYQCEPVSQLPDSSQVSLDVRRWGCSGENHYNDLATYFFSQTEESIKHLFHSEQRFAYSSLASHFFPYLFLTILTYGIGVPSGLFLPSLSLGASMGRFFAQGVEDCLGIGGLHLGAYSCFGAAACLAGVIRMTVSLSVIVMEATGNATYIVPLMIISCTAKFVGDLLSEHGIYDAHIHFSRVPLLEDKLTDPRLQALTASCVMNRGSFPILPPQPTAEEVLTALSAHEEHNGFVITQDGTAAQPVRGIILRRWLMILIREGAYGAGGATPACDSLTSAHFVKSARERELLKLATYAVLSVPTHRLGDRLNLARYMDAFPFTVHNDTPLPRVYDLFRSMGLRHLIVVDRAGRPCGLVSRKNLVHIAPAAELRVDPADGVAKPRGGFREPAEWQTAEPYAQSFADKQRHPSQQRFADAATNFVPAEEALLKRRKSLRSLPLCPSCRGSGRRTIFAGVRRACGECDGRGTMPDATYFTVGAAGRVSGDLFIDPQEDDGAPSVTSPALRLDLARGRFNASPIRLGSPRRKLRRVVSAPHVPSAACPAPELAALLPTGAADAGP